MKKFIVTFELQSKNDVLLTTLVDEEIEAEFFEDLIGMKADEDHGDLDFSSFDHFHNQDDDGYFSEVVIIKDEKGNELYRHVDFDVLNDAYILSKMKHLNDIRSIKEYFEGQSKKTLPSNLPDIKIKNIYLRIIENLKYQIDQQEKDQQEKDQEEKDQEEKDQEEYLCIFPF